MPFRGSGLLTRLHRRKVRACLPAPALALLEAHHSPAAVNPILCRTLLAAFACGGGSVFAAVPAKTAAAELLFARKVWPLLQEKCLACHGKEEDKIKGDFDLRTRESFAAGGASGFAPVNGRTPARSPILRAVRRHDGDFEPMPPKENDRLSDEQIAYLEKWVNAGAPWPDAARMAELAKVASPWDAADGVMVKTSGGLADEWTNRRYKPEDLWAYRPLKRSPVPGIGAGETEGKREIEGTRVGERRASLHLPVSPSPYLGRNPIDAFIAARLPAGLTPASPADRRTLLRRATFDLVGLPPTPEEIAAFLGDADSDERAFTHVVERLLASPHYGEKWGRHWLDVARYADSSGFANDFVRGNAWRYRDYVVRAFNDDKPYDRFIREQIAGDEMAAAEASGSPPDPLRTSEMLVATGFLRMGPWELTGMEVPKVARQRFLDDVTQTVGETFLGQALQCARCHDHKIDPVPTRDYYSMQAIFATTQLADRPAAFLPAENRAGFEEKKYLEQRQEFYRGVLKRLDEKSLAAARAWYADKQIDPAPFEQAVAEVLGTRNNRGRDAGYAEVRAALMKRGIPEERIPPKLAGFTPEDYGQERIARKGLERLKWDFDRYEPVAFSVYSGRTPELKSVLAPMRMSGGRAGAGELEETCIRPGGDPFASGPKVRPAVPSAATILGEMQDAPIELPTAIEGRRLALADWIAAEKNPLTARVMVNRIWLWHFGQALAGNPNNLGATGRKPTHPELLDWLAATFIERGWSVKSLHRLIMNSNTYRRAAQHPEPARLAEKDPNKTSYAVFQPRRLTAEELRDTMLHVTGELNPMLGGIPVRPEVNREVALQPRQVMGTFAEAWQPSPTPAQRHRRSLYVQQVRGLGDPFMEVFNAPSPDLSCERRDASTVTPQVFSMFNSQASYHRALAFATRLMKETKSRDAALCRAFGLAYGRAPGAGEVGAGLAHWDAMTARHRTLKFEPTAVRSEVVREAVEENTGERFTFTEPLEAAADFIPDLQPAAAAPDLRGLAEVCLVLLNSNEFAYVY
ncbi:MAG: PSD1 domain-containing protein [Verrucomicrobia bacterium]|nr:PSD1 domain-containing protein [Verrucomicrobiota bacterium]